MFAVYVEFHLHDDQINAFIERVKANARVSVLQEPGCIQFDVCQDGDQPNVIWLYELYGSRFDFDEHLVSSHFKDFAADTSAMVIEKHIRIGERFAIEERSNLVVESKTGI